MASSGKVTGLRSAKSKTLTVDGAEYSIEIIEIPFREGVELRCKIGDDEIRISDRQLGESEALRLMEDEIRKRKT